MSGVQYAEESSNRIFTYAYLVVSGLNFQQHKTFSINFMVWVYQIFSPRTISAAKEARVCEKELGTIQISLSMYYHTW